MNGKPIPLAHGGPLHLTVPGYTGVNNIKYIKRLAFTAEETDAAIQKTGYRISPPDEKGDPSQPSVWDLPPDPCRLDLRDKQQSFSLQVLCKTQHPVVDRLPFGVAAGISLVG